jgi:acetolactate synthase-1/2/3 large subunit
LFILGSGIRLGKAQKAVRELCTNLQIPVITAHTAKDVFDNFNERYFGIFGTCGNRHANVILQNSDLVVALGVGLTISKTGFNFKNFAPLARKIVVDIDRGQVFDLAVAPDHGVVADVGNLIPKLVRALNSQGAVNHAEWFSLCCEWRSKYAEIDLAPEYDRSVNPYRLMRQLSQISLATDTITTGNGLDSVAYCQSFKVKEGQHTLLNGNWGSMGWDLPLSVGAHFATKGRVLCITGDGSIMLNIQELLNIGARQLPIKVFVLNNQGYGSIKATQDSVFNSNYIGVDSNSGVYNPDFKLIATGFGLGYAQIDNDKDMATALDNILSTDTPELIEVRVDKSTWITPKASSFKDEKGVMHSRDLDDMFPFLERSEITNNRALALKIS